MHPRCRLLFSMSTLAIAVLVVSPLGTACYAPDTMSTYAPRGPQPVPPPGDSPGTAQRRVTFNRAPLDEPGWRVIAQLEAVTGRRLPDGDYWYDAACGAAGAWGGPALAIIPAGLPLGGRLPAEASGGGRGDLTGVFINGRELHPVDVAGLWQLTGHRPQPGRYWVDAYGNAGYEGGSAFANLLALARQRGGTGYFRATSGAGGNLYTGSDGSTSYFFDGASGCSVLDGSVSC